MVDNLITLYEDNETEFLTNGLGGLRDAVKCTVYEEKNGEYELTLRYPITGRHYSELIMRRIIFAKPDPYRYAQPFRIYNISKPHDGIVTISAHHISYDLSGYPIAPFKAATLSLVMNELNSQMTRAFNKKKPPFHFSHRKNEIATEMNLVAPCSARAILGGSEGTILDKYHGEYEWDRWNVILHNNRGQNRGVRIAYGKNLTSLEQEENCEKVWTGVYPYWYFESDEGSKLVELGTKDEEKILYLDGNYKHERIMILDLSSEFQDPPTSAQLRQRAQQYINDNELGSPNVSLSVSFVNLADTTNYANIKILEQVMLCDTVTVDFPKLGVSSTSKVISTTYNVLTNKYETVELGESKSSLSTTIADQGSVTQKALNEQKSALQKGIESVSKLITGGLGGYVLLHSSDSNEKYPDEILIMDTPDINTAEKVWRWNHGGLGYSNTGYGGPFELAITMDGSIVANFIKTGKLNGELIEAGTLLADTITNGTMSADRISGGVLKIGDFDNVKGLVEVSGQTPNGISCKYTIGWPYGLTSDGRVDATVIGADNYNYEPSSSESQEVPSIPVTIPILGAECNSSFQGARFTWPVKVQSDFTVTGTKNREIRTDNYGKRLQYCYETSTPMFGDIGFGQMDENGVCIVSIDDIFSETVSKTVRYAVFLQKEGPGDLWVSEKNLDYFIINGTPGLKFVWELKGYQRDYECVRLEASGNDLPGVLSDFDHVQGYINEVNELIQEQEDVLYAHSEAVK